VPSWPVLRWSSPLPSVLWRRVVVCWVRSDVSGLCIATSSESYIRPYTIPNCWRSATVPQHWRLKQTHFSGQNWMESFLVLGKLGLQNDGTKFCIHGSVHRESNWITAQEDATVFSLLRICRQLYMFRLFTPIIRSWYNCNYSLWRWSTGSATIRSRCWVGTQLGVTTRNM